MASKRGRRRKVTHVVNDENSGFESRKPPVSNCEVVKAQMVVEGLRAKYKHKLKEKEINVQPSSVQIITEPGLPSPTKIAKLEQIKPQVTEKELLVEESSKITKLRRVSSRTRRKLVDQNPAAKHESKDMPVIQESSIISSSTPIRKDTFEFDSPDIHLSTATTISLDDSCQSSKTETDKNPTYMKLLNFKTPEVKTRKKTGRRRNRKATNPSETTEEEWIKRTNEEFAEVDEFDLIVQ